jgi:serine/threonine protein kinase
VWSLGIVTYECCAGRHPFDAQNVSVLIRKIMKGDYPPLQGPYSKQLADVIQVRKGPGQGGGLESQKRAQGSPGAAGAL